MDNIRKKKAAEKKAVEIKEAEIKEAEEKNLIRNYGFWDDVGHIFLFLL